jgi:hypothetical protein
MCISYQRIENCQVFEFFAGRVYYKEAISCFFMKYNDLLIEKFHHDTILVQGDRVVYFDPYNIDMINMPRADII